MNTTKIQEQFSGLYGDGGVLYTAPGRINLIGEHTDYNGGFVLPGAVDKAIYCKIKPNGLYKARVFALDLNEQAEFGLREEDKPKEGWAKYIFGVCREMNKRGREIAGFDAVVSGDVPLEAGMSSSAALESAVGFALNDTFNFGFTRQELALIGQATEHNYVGVKCGIMDQFISCLGRAGSLLRLDCRSLAYEYVPFFPDGYKLTLINSCVKHNLAVGGEYNKRRESCERVVAEIARKHPEVKLLRDATPDLLQEMKDRTDATDYVRAEFVIEEIQRLLDACEALQKGDYETVGRKMYETHDGLSKKYTVSSPELDFLNEQARQYGVTGSRVMGGGFGGCTINLVKADKADAFLKGATEAYEQAFHTKPEMYDVVIGEGARKI
ncbi:MAG: galactokinase [Dysgonamonadaceae bacterium]|jgi:galactokinase|nr:galactokinase [Dysgonamonadaceae bacterium]